ncbi:MAG TPA: hypothetical protein VF265_04710 [Nevskiaceae bacterium]
MTTPLPPSKPHDDDLPGEAELKALYGRLPPHEPGPALDAAVLRAAAQAVATTTPRRRARWPVALGTAATLVLAAGLGWQMRELPVEAPMTSPVPASAAAIETKASADRQAVPSAEAVAPSTQPTDTQTLERDSTRRSAPAAKLIGAGTVSPPPAAAGYVAPATNTAAGMAPPNRPAPSLRASAAPAAKSAIAAPTPVVDKATINPAPALVPSLLPHSANADAQAEAAVSAMEDSVPPAPPEPPAPPAPAAQLAAPAPAAPPATSPQRTPSAPPAPPPAWTQATPAQETAAAPGAAPAALPAPSMPTSLSVPVSIIQHLREVEPIEPATPAMTAELQAIRTLYERGDDTAARTRLEAFRREHPHVVLPDDLRQRLDSTP